MTEDHEKGVLEVPNSDDGPECVDFLEIKFQIVNKMMVTESQLGARQSVMRNIETLKHEPKRFVRWRLRFEILKEEPQWFVHWALQSEILQDVSKALRLMPWLL